MKEYFHIPVMLEEVLDFTSKKGGQYLMNSWRWIIYPAIGP